MQVTTNREHARALPIPVWSCVHMAYGHRSPAFQGLGLGCIYTESGLFWLLAAAG
jgi:hypothetical protein